MGSVYRPTNCDGKLYATILSLQRLTMNETKDWQFLSPFVFASYQKLIWIKSGLSGWWLHLKITRWCVDRENGHAHSKEFYSSIRMRSMLLITKPSSYVSKILKLQAISFRLTPHLQTFHNSPKSNGVGQNTAFLLIVRCIATELDGQPNLFDLTWPYLFESDDVKVGWMQKYEAVKWVFK